MPCVDTGFRRDWARSRKDLVASHELSRLCDDFQRTRHSCCPTALPISSAASFTSLSSSISTQIRSPNESLGGESFAGEFIIAPKPLARRL